MANNNTAYINAGKPKVGGAFYIAPAGTTLPTDATTALTNAFVCAGYISDAGFKNNNARETAEVKAWGGDIVLTQQYQRGVQVPTKAGNHMTAVDLTDTGNGDALIFLNGGKCGGIFGNGFEQGKELFHRLPPD